MASKEKREEWKRAGLCARCGKNKPADGRLTCQSCLDEGNYNRAYKREHGLCVKCGRNKVAPNRKYCDVCLEQRHMRYEAKKKTKEYINFVKLYNNRYRDRRKENNLCVKCGKPVYENYSLCYDHLFEQRNCMRRRRAFAKEVKEN